MFRLCRYSSHSFQCERHQIDLRVHTVVESSPVLDDLVNDPRRGGSTDNQQNVLAGAAPAVPEMLQGRNEIGLGRIHPRDLVNEDHLLFFLPAGFDANLQGIEGIGPAGKFRTILVAVVNQRSAESGKLTCNLLLRDACVLEA